MKHAMKQVIAVMPWAYHTIKTAREGNISIPTTPEDMVKYVVRDVEVVKGKK